MRDIYRSLTILTLVALAQFVSVEAVWCDNAQPAYDWIIQMEAQEVTDFVHFRNPDSKLLVKVGITYRKSTDATDKVTKYEDLWYKQTGSRSFEPISAKMYNPLVLRVGDQTVLRLTRKSQRGLLGQSTDLTDAEVSAGTNSMVRVLLDAFLKGYTVTALIVPANSFPKVLQNMAVEHFQVASDDPSQTITSPVVIYLVGDPGSDQKSLYYSP